MKAVVREPILNKITAFSADPHFRHLLGQTDARVSIRKAMDDGLWVLVRLPKGRLGEHAATLGSLFLSRIKQALFARRSRNLVTLYCDEVQNLVAYDDGLDTLLSEARKFGVSICSANQFLDQYPAAMRSAILSVGSHVLFRLAVGDADRMASALNGGKRLRELLQNLSHRTAVAKVGSNAWTEFKVPFVRPVQADDRLLQAESRHRWARSRTEVEASIRQRQAQWNRRNPEVNLHDWE